MLNLKVNNKYSCSIPQHEGELTLDFYLKFISLPSDELEFLSTLTGCPIEELKETNNTKLDELIYSSLSFLSNEFANHIQTLQPPKYLQLGAKRFKIPNDLEFETLGQKIEAKNLIANTEKIEQSIPDLIAIYISKDSKGRDYLKRKILESRAIDILPIARFFFLKFKESVRSGIAHSNQDTIKKKVKQT